MNLFCYVHSQSKAMNELKMTLNLKEGETSNMFEGPASLLKERDACGVGFIANTQNGGKSPVCELDYRMTKPYQCMQENRH